MCFELLSLECVCQSWPVNSLNVKRGDVSDVTCVPHVFLVFSGRAVSREYEIKTVGKSLSRFESII